MRTRKSIVAATAFVAILAAACGGDDGGDDAAAASGGDGGGNAPGGAVTLTARELAWDPATLTVAAGGSVEVVNEDDAKHNLTIEDADVDEDVEGGASATVDLGGLEAGSYEFVCEYHPDTMTGTLEVE